MYKRCTLAPRLDEIWSHIALVLFKVGAIVLLEHTMVFDAPQSLVNRIKLSQKNLNVIDADFASAY